MLVGCNLGFSGGGWLSFGGSWVGGCDLGFGGVVGGWFLVFQFFVPMVVVVAAAV